MPRQEKIGPDVFLNSVVRQRLEAEFKHAGWYPMPGNREAPRYYVLELNYRRFLRGLLAVGGCSMGLHRKQIWIKPGRKLRKDDPAIGAKAGTFRPHEFRVVEEFRANPLLMHALPAKNAQLGFTSSGTAVAIKGISLVASELQGHRVVAIGGAGGGSVKIDVGELAVMHFVGHESFGPSWDDGLKCQVPLIVLRFSLERMLSKSGALLPVAGRIVFELPALVYRSSPPYVLLTEPELSPPAWNVMEINMLIFMRCLLLGLTTPFHSFNGWSELAWRVAVEGMTVSEVERPWAGGSARRLEPQRTFTYQVTLAWCAATLVMLGEHSSVPDWRAVIPGSEPRHRLTYGFSSHLVRDGSLDGLGHQVFLQDEGYYAQIQEKMDADIVRFQELVNNGSPIVTGVLEALENLPDASGSGNAGQPRYALMKWRVNRLRQRWKEEHVVLLGIPVMLRSEPPDLDDPSEKAKYDIGELVVSDSALRQAQRLHLRRVVAEFSRNAWCPIPDYSPELDREAFFIRHTYGTMLQRILLHEGLPNTGRALAFEWQRVEEKSRLGPEEREFRLNPRVISFVLDLDAPPPQGAAILFTTGSTEKARGSRVTIASGSLHGCPFVGFSRGSQELAPKESLPGYFDRYPEGIAIVHGVLEGGFFWHPKLRAPARYCILVFELRSLRPSTVDYFLKIEKRKSVRVHLPVLVHHSGRLDFVDQRFPWPERKRLAWYVEQLMNTVLFADGIEAVAGRKRVWDWTVVHENSEGHPVVQVRWMAACLVALVEMPSITSGWMIRLPADTQSPRVPLGFFVRKAGDLCDLGTLGHRMLLTDEGAEEARHRAHQVAKVNAGKQHANAQLTATKSDIDNDVQRVLLTWTIREPVALQVELPAVLFDKSLVYPYTAELQWSDQDGQQSRLDDQYLRR